MMATRAWQREKTKAMSPSATESDETILPGEAEAGVIWYER